MGNARKRRRGLGDLSQVAEIVMVLAAAGQARAGRKPTEAERALVAEARGRLAAAAAVKAARPRELYPREAVRALVDDLGLARSRDPARPRRPSISHRILLTSRKMEQSRESPVHPTTNVPGTTTNLSATSVFQHVASKFAAGLHRNLSAAASTPAPVAMASVNLKQSRTNETPAGLSSTKSTSVASIVSLPPAGSANIEVEKGVNFTQSGETIGQGNTSAHVTPTRSSQSMVRSSSGEKSEEKNATSIQPVKGNTIIGHQFPPGEASIQQNPCFSNHGAIAKTVQQVLHQPANHPSWTLPSTEYMNACLDCQICRTFTMDVESLLVCDACERGVHLECLQHYGDEGLPSAEWYCPTCIAHIKGKPLPPKYGKVMRAVVAPKASQTSVQRASENPCTNDISEKAAGSGRNSSEAGISLRNSDGLALDTSSKAQLAFASEDQKGNTEHTETLSKQKEGHGPPSRGLVTEAVESSCEFGSSGASTNSGADDLLEQSHMQSETS